VQNAAAKAPPSGPAERPQAGPGNAVFAITVPLVDVSFGDPRAPFRIARLPELRDSSEIDMETASGTTLAPAPADTSL
jgi:hypothetical protein